MTQLHIVRELCGLLLSELNYFAFAIKVQSFDAIFRAIDKLLNRAIVLTFNFE